MKPTPPPKCTCLWSSSTNGAYVYISMGEECPAWPHPRSVTYDTENDNAQ